MKKLILILLASITPMFGAVATGSNLGGANSAAGTNATVVTTGVVIQGLTLYSTNQTPTVVYLYDGFYIKTNAAYTNWLVYTTNQVVTYITTTGITNTMTNTVIANVANPVAATTNSIETPVVTYIIPGAPSGGVGLVSDNKSYSFAQRVTISNSLPGTSYLINYRSP